MSEASTQNVLPTPTFVGDLAQLPGHAHSHRSMTWWGMMCLIAIESTAFVLACASYFYLKAHSVLWPPRQLVPSLGPGTWFIGILLASFIPNMWLNRKAEEEVLKPVQIGLVLMSLIGIVLVVIRVFEFPAMHVAWSDSAYGSIVITILGLHTVHLVTDLFDTVVLTVLMFTRHAGGRRYVDVAENAIYWNFVVFAWVPIYAILYFFPRWV